MKKYYFQCPRCKNDDSFRQVSEDASATERAMFLWGGIVPNLIYWFGQAGRVQCARCSHIFKRPPLPQSPVVRLSRWFFLVLLSAIAAVALVCYHPWLWHRIPHVEYLMIIEDFVRNHPAGTVAGLLVLLLGLLFLLTFASIIGTYRLRKKIKSQYLIFPDPD